MIVQMATAVAPVNIAIIKYWGKRNEELILPVNDSLSVTLSKNKMCAKTTVACCKEFESDRIWLNGKEEDILNPRLQKCIQEIRQKCKNKKYIDWHLHICSENNFPTAAGLASSAAGFACLVKALSFLYDVDEDLSKIARQGSGSACRSMYGGFVQWHSGTHEDGSDSFAEQIATKDHWPELKSIILVVNASKKEVSSTKGMQQSVLTSTLLKHRTADIVPIRVREIKKAILKKDFQIFSDITMEESNQFHAICLDTFPPIHYLNSTSYRIIKLIHNYNEFYGQNKVAYTFDAGPNACLYLLEKDVPEVLSLIKTVFPPTEEKTDFIRGLDVPTCSASKMLLESLQITPFPDALSFVINTEVGSGPTIIKDTDQHLLNQSGFPKTTCQN